MQAAGTVLWRPGALGKGTGREVAVVHRPRYDDWSLPKGKVRRSEHPAAAAVRECVEETGFDAVLGQRLGTSRYVVQQDGAPRDKVVQWWAARCAAGQFAPGDEVDDLRWLPVAAAAALVTEGRDVDVLDELAAAPPHPSTVVLVRHGRAGRSQDWPGPDADRPLDARGVAQAERLAELLPLWGVRRLVAAPPPRCTDTFAPLARALDLTVEVDPLVGDAGYAQDPGAARARILSYADPQQAVAICSQGGALLDLLSHLSRRGPAKRRTRKGHAWVVTLDGLTVVAVDRLDPTVPATPG